METTQNPLPSTGLKMSKNKRIILLRMNTTSPLEFCRAVSLPTVILGQNKANATTEEMITKMATNRRVTVAWKRCHPAQHCTVGKLVITYPPGPFWHSTTFSNSQVMGRNNTVTKSGTTWASTTNGKVKRNFFLEKEQLTQTMSATISRITRMRP